MDSKERKPPYLPPSRSEAAVKGAPRSERRERKRSLDGRRSGGYGRRPSWPLIFNPDDKPPPASGIRAPRVNARHYKN
jgi:hypothetical protein